MKCKCKCTIASAYDSSELVDLHPPNSHVSYFSSFTTVNFYFISKHISSMNPTTCILDPFPTTVQPVIVPYITAIVNTSLDSGVVPSTLKTAAIKPVLKKLGSDIDEMSNYRPISNLPFIAKDLECLVVSQLQIHLSTNRILEPFQSGFRS